MGVVSNIYTSKVNEVQQRMQAIAGRTGIAIPSFRSFLEMAQNEPPLSSDTEAPQSVPTDTAAVRLSARSGEYDTIVSAAAQTYDMDANLIKAVIQAESSFRTDAVSNSGAQGLMQLKPGTAAGLGVDNTFDPIQNILGGAEYLKKQYERFGDMRLALAAYNTGPSAIARMASTGVEGEYDYERLTQEERRYVDKVFAYYNAFNASTL